MPLAYLGLGANLGNRYQSLLSALVRLAEILGGVEVSAVYETQPWGVADQPNFLNCACRGQFSESPQALLAAVKRIEFDLGRRPTRHWGERVIDIDILIFGDRAISSPQLTIPHPLIAQRRFVCAPLSDLASDLSIAPDSRSASAVARDLAEKEELAIYRQKGAVALDLAAQLSQC